MNKIIYQIKNLKFGKIIENNQVNRRDSLILHKNSHKIYKMTKNNMMVLIKIKKK